MAGTFGDHLSQLPLHRRGNCGQTRSKSCPGFIQWQISLRVLNLSQLRVCVLCYFTHVWLFVTLRTVAHQAPLSMGFSGPVYWSGLPCCPPRGSSQPRDWTHVSCIPGRFFSAEPLGEALSIILLSYAADSKAWKARMIYKLPSWTQGKAAWKPGLFLHTSPPLRSVAGKHDKEGRGAIFVNGQPRVGHRNFTLLSLIILIAPLLCRLFHRWRKTGSERLCCLPKVAQAESGRAEMKE